MIDIITINIQKNHLFTTTFISSTSVLLHSTFPSYFVILYFPVPITFIVTKTPTNPVFSPPILCLNFSPFLGRLNTDARRGQSALIYTQFQFPFVAEYQKRSASKKISPQILGTFFVFWANRFWRFENCFTKAK